MSYYSPKLSFFTSLGLLLLIAVVADHQQNSSTTTVAVQPTVSDPNPCGRIEKAFGSVLKQGERPICQCLMNVPSSLDDQSQFWIGCTRHKMTAVFRALQTLNDTHISHLHIWDSLINILPNDPKPMFTQVHADQLTIERSRVGVIREGAFANVGRTLKSLNLRNNILKSVEAKALVDLSELRHLDLSWNKLAELRRAHLANMVHLETLVLAGNQLSKLDDAMFEPLTKLRTLNLANNSIKRITKNTFKGLPNLEVLTLTANRIDFIDRDAFAHLKALKVLELGVNNISSIELRGNTMLERLVLNNNSITSLAACLFDGLTSLRSLQLGNNNISSIGDVDLRGLAHSPALNSLSLDGNNISRISCRAFVHVPGLRVLSLQRNRISTLSCAATHDPISFIVYLDQSFLHPLHQLQRLLLSHNVIQFLNEDDLNSMEALQELALDHNIISKISKRTFAGVRLRKLFLNNNHLYYLPKGVFAGWDLSNVQAVDISDNIWECICEQEWIGAWLKALGEANAYSGSLGCLLDKCDNNGDKTHIEEDECSEESAMAEGYYEEWIRLIACVLAFVAILFLVIAGYVYMQESRHTVTIGRSSSDRIRLIPSMESLFSLPNPIIGPTEVPKVQQIRPDNPNYLNPSMVVPSIAINASGGRIICEELVDRKEEAKSKRVRFQ